MISLPHSGARRLTAGADLKPITTYVDCLALSGPSQRVFAPSLTSLEGFRKQIREKDPSTIKKIAQLQKLLGKGETPTMSLSTRVCGRGRRFVRSV